MNSCFPSYSATQGKLFQTSIKNNNPKRRSRTLGDGEKVEFDIIKGSKVLQSFITVFKSSFRDQKSEALEVSYNRTVFRAWKP